MTKLGAYIEIIEPVADPEMLPCIKPRVVHINGVDVGLIAKGGIRIENVEGDNNDAIKVTLTLYPRRVTIRAGKLEEEG